MAKTRIGLETGTTGGWEWDCSVCGGVSFLGDGLGDRVLHSRYMHFADLGLCSPCALDTCANCGFASSEHRVDELEHVHCLFNSTRFESYLHRWERLKKDN